MNPYPFVGLNHFTVPVGISCSKEEYCTAKLALTPLNEHINVTMASVFLNVAHGATERQAFTAAKGRLCLKKNFCSLRVSFWKYCPTPATEFGLTMNTSLLPTLPAE